MLKDIQFIWQFGWRYLDRYRTRLILGMSLGLLCGLSNAMFPWAVKTLAQRLAPSPAVEFNSATAAQGLDPGSAAAKTIANEPAGWSGLDKSLRSLQEKTDAFLDRWLPRAGQPFTVTQAVGCFLFLPFLVFIRGFLSYLSGYCMKWVSERMINDMRFDVLAKLQTLSLDYFNKMKSGDLMMRLSADTKAIYYCLYFAFADLVREPFAVMGIFVALWWVDWQLTLFSLVFLPVCVVPIVILGRKTRKAGKGSLEAEISQSNLLMEGIANIRVVKAFGLEGLQEERFRKYAQERIRHNMRANRAEELLNPIVEVTSALAVGGMLFFIFYTGRSLPNLLAFATGLGLFYTPVKKLAKVHLHFQRALFGVERIRQTFAEQPSVREAPNAAALAPFARSIQFDNVTFGYDETPVLQQVSLEARKGQKIGIAGPSGSGKSTLVNLLFRFYDVTEGAIRIDGADIRSLSVSSLRRQMALVSQEIFLFDGTVAENIGYGKLGASRAEIVQAARMAGAESFIEQLPQGYETRIGERGVLLSGGQKQRLAIARAFVRNAPILVLDEATAALDSATEAEVQSALEKLSADRTVISVAHRLSTLRHCDLIVVLHEGKITESGSFNDLLERQGMFAAMASRQGIHAVAR